jgi:hypothetical protein
MKYLLLLSVFVFAFISCEKAGTGGKSTVIVHGIHDNIGTPGAIVYCKFNETSYNPNWTGGDLMDTINNFSEIEFGPLKRGDYYFYSEYTFVNDSGFVETVKGGKHIHLGTKPSAYHLTIDFSATNPFE